MLPYLFWRCWRSWLMSAGVAFSVWLALLKANDDGAPLSYLPWLAAVALTLWSELLGCSFLRDGSRDGGLPALLTLPTEAWRKVGAAHLMHVTMPLLCALVGMLLASAVAYIIGINIDYRGQDDLAAAAAHPEALALLATSLLLSHAVFCLAGVALRRFKWLAAFLLHCIALALLTRLAVAAAQHYDNAQYVVHIDRLDWWLAAICALLTAALAWLILRLFRRLQAAQGAFINV